MVRRLAPALVAVLCVACSLARADPLIDTHQYWDGTQSVSPFGNYQETATYGQVFTVSSSDVGLTSFSFWLQPLDTEPVDLRAYVASWDEADNRATGAMLYASDPFTVPGGTSVFDPYVFNPVDVNLTEGQEYVAFLSGSANWSATDETLGNAAMGAIPGGAPGHDASQGYFVYSNNGADFGALTTAPWDSTGSLGKLSDAAFKADFGPSSGPGPGPGSGGTPEPASIVLLGASCGMFGVLRRRKAKR